jgi:hypothetical protein
LSDNDAAIPVLNILDKGEQKLKSASLKTFNNKIRGLMSRQFGDDEVDDILRADYAEVGADNNDADGANEDDGDT